ncbi:MAG: universal stress protein, partial [Rhodothermales bacterium]|nr:universal stress protein [Rhodothermales bacterium]
MQNEGRKSPNPALARPVLIAVDFSADSQRALVGGLEFIGSRAVELHLVHVHVPFEEGDLTGTQESAMLTQLEHMYQKASSSRLISERTVVSYSVERDIAPAAALLRYAAENRIELMITGTHGRRGFRRLILGSVAEEIVRMSRCPVLTIGGHADCRLGPETESILVPVDFSDESSRTLTASRTIANEYSASLDILHVVEEAVHPAFYNTGVFSVYDVRPDLDRQAIRELEKL